MERYLDTKAAVVGISLGNPEQRRRSAEKRRLPMPLLADPGRTVTGRYLRYGPFPISFLRGVVVIDADGVIRNTDVMLRAFRPRDEKIITDIYAARGDALNQEYEHQHFTLRAATSRG